MYDFILKIHTLSIMRGEIQTKHVYMYETLHSINYVRKLQWDIMLKYFPTTPVKSEVSCDKTCFFPRPFTSMVKILTSKLNFLK